MARAWARGCEALAPRAPVGDAHGMLAPGDATAFLIPRLATPRLTLRAFRRDDFDAYAEHLADPPARPPGLAPVDRRMAWRMFTACLGSWALDGAGWWALELRATGLVVGTVGAFFRETHAPGEPARHLELGWSVYRPHWRRGYASEGAAAALRDGRERLGARRAIAHIDPSNEASLRVAARLGMTFEGEVDFYGATTGLYALDL